jgi:hypothetical protein
MTGRETLEVTAPEMDPRAPNQAANHTPPQATAPTRPRNENTEAGSDSLAPRWR